MCTMTVAPLSDGRVRVAFNRDERRDRPVARPPRRWKVGPRVAVLPVDPQSGGTWLAANDAGLILALLNVSSDTAARPAKRSRGEIIPALLGCGSPAEAVGALAQVIEYADFAPFRLVLVGSGMVADVCWDGVQAMATTRLLGGRPLMYTSSGLGDRLVEGVRRELFDAAFAGPHAGWADAQDGFHRHTLPGAEHLSVNMSRADARTVSRAVVTVDDSGTEFTYHADAADGLAEANTLKLALAAGVA